MAYSDRAFRQLGNPSGLMGRVVLWWLNKVNRGMNRATLEALALVEGDSVLEIGFGGGALLSRIIAHDQVSSIAGTDISPLVLEAAARKFRREIDAGRAEFRQCGESDLPFDAGSFSKVCCVNVIYFWPDIPVTLGEVYRVVSAGGRFVTCYAEGSPDTVTKFPAKRVEQWLRDAGFRNVETTQGHDRENGTYHCTVAFKP